MTTIEKQQFKITIPGIISVITCTITIIVTLYSMRDQASADLNALKSEFQQIKSKQDVIVIQQQYQFQNLKNDRKRDSALFANGFQDLKTEIKETQSILIRSSSNRAITDN